MKDLDKERELILKCLEDLNNRLRALELKFNMNEEESWELWHNFNRIIDELKITNNPKPRRRR